MKKLILLIILLITAVILPDSDVHAMNGMMGRWGPYGDYCPMHGSYGARKIVKTAEEAKKILQEYFSKDNVKIGQITEKRWFFKAEILDKNNALIDIVIMAQAWAVALERAVEGRILLIEFYL